MCTVNLLDGTASRLDELSIQQTEKEHNKNNDDVENECLSKQEFDKLGWLRIYNGKENNAKRMTISVGDRVSFDYSKRSVFKMLALWTMKSNR